jgi:Zn-dependent protease with chaperone function
VDGAPEDSARQVMAAAARAARAAGADAVDCGHLLAALRQVDDGQVLPPGSPATGGPAPGSREVAGGGEPDPQMPVSRHVRLVLENASRQVTTRNHQRMDYSHLLAGAVVVHRFADGQDGTGAGAPCAIGALVREADGGLRVLLDSVVRHMYARVSDGFPYVGTDFVLSRAERRLAWAQRAVIVGGYAALGALACGRMAPGPARAAVAGCLVAALAGLPLLQLWLASLYIAARARQPDAVHVPATGLAQALARTGRRRLDVVLLPPGGTGAGSWLGEAFGFWGRGMIVMDPVTRDMPPDLVRFVAAHEAAHLARGDSATQTMAFVYLAALTVALVVGDADLWLVIPVASLVIASRWIAELACDRIAARITGQIPSLSFAGYLGPAYRRKQDSRLARLRRLLTHPPASLRRRAIIRGR